MYIQYKTYFYSHSEHNIVWAALVLAEYLSCINVTAENFRVSWFNFKQWFFSVLMSASKINKHVTRIKTRVDKIRLA